MITIEINGVICEIKKDTFYEMACNLEKDTLIYCDKDNIEKIKNLSEFLPKIPEQECIGTIAGIKIYAK